MIAARAALSPTAHMLYPIISATATAAVTKLQERVVSVLGPADSPSAAACIDASRTMESIAKYVVVAAQTTNPECTDVCRYFPMQGYLSDASPWVLAWLMAHPHLRPSPHRGLEKLILSFLNSVSGEFLDLLEPILDRKLTIETDDGLGAPTGSGLGAIESDYGLRPEQLVAAEIFAHWLVLLMLVETEWWVGDLGLQELTKLVDIVKGHHLLRGSSLTPNTPIDPQLQGSPEPVESWWPESLLNVAVELKEGSPTV